MKQKNFLKYGAFLMLYVFQIAPAWSQGRIISGTISDLSTGESLSGVSITAKGTNASAASTEKGYFSIPGSRAEPMSWFFHMLVTLHSR